MQHKRESNDGVHEQDANMHNDDKEKQSPTEEESHVTVSRTEKQKMIQTETARDKDYHPLPHIVPSRNTLDFRHFGIMSTAVN